MKTKKKDYGKDVCLKACPFCREGELEEYKWTDYHGERGWWFYSVRCQYCGALGPPCATWRQAKEEWNKRPRKISEGRSKEKGHGNHNL